MFVGPDTNLEELFDISIMLLAAATPAPSYPSSSSQTSTNEKSSSSPTGTPPHAPHFDFFLLHLLLSAHAIRILFKHLPYAVHATLLEAQFLATISYYVSELRPQVKRDLVINHKGAGGADWGWVRGTCFEVDVASECANGGNYVRALRVLREAEVEYGVKEGLYLNAALMIVEQMDGVVGD
jgi:hypothetical protein